MSSKKKRNSKKGKTLIMETIAGFIIIILILLWLLGSKLTGGGKTVYKIEPRGSNISSVKLSDDSGFDTIGWLRVQGTSIDYPIIQAVDDVEKEFAIINIIIEFVLVDIIYLIFRLILSYILICLLDLKN